MPAGRPHIVSYAAKWDERHVDYAGTRPVPGATPPPEDKTPAPPEEDQRDFDKQMDEMLKRLGNEDLMKRIDGMKQGRIPDPGAP